MTICAAVKTHHSQIVQIAVRIAAGQVLVEVRNLKQNKDELQAQAQTTVAHTVETAAVDITLVVMEVAAAAVQRAAADTTAVTAATIAAAVAQDVITHPTTQTVLETDLEAVQTVDLQNALTALLHDLLTVEAPTRVQATTVHKMLIA